MAGDTRDREMARRTRWWEIWGAVTGLIGFWIAGGLGVVGKAGLEGRVGGWVGRVYDRLYTRVVRLE